MIRHVNKQSKDTLRWVRKAMASDTYPNLHNVCVKDDWVIATNGYQVHKARIQHTFPLADGCYKLAFYEDMVFFEKENVESYPDVEKAFPVGEPAVRFAATASLLETVISMPFGKYENGLVVFELYADVDGRQQPYIIRNVKGDKVAALMPASGRNTKGLSVCTWVLDDEDYNSWEAGCGDDRSFVFESGTPEENGFRHCPYCGNILRVNGEV